MPKNFIKMLWSELVNATYGILFRRFRMPWHAFQKKLFARCQINSKSVEHRHLFRFGFYSFLTA